MAIPQTKYVDTKSIVGVTNLVNSKNFNLRLFTTNDLLPATSVVEFTDADQVKNYFGETSEEYIRALKYFTWVSKLFTSPTKISFARWVNVAAPFKIYTASVVTLASLKETLDGEFIITYGGVDYTVNDLDFTAAALYNDIAIILQTKIRALSNSAFTNAVVSYDATKNRFIIVGTVATANVPIKIKTTTNDATTAIKLGLLPQDIDGSGGAIWNGAVLAETITNALINAVDKSNNFGSFVFMPTLTLDRHVEVAQWMQLSNILYQYHLLVTNTNDAQSYYAALKDFSGVGITYSIYTDQYEDDFPGTILASINFDLPDSVQNFMFQQGDYKPSVLTKMLSDQLDDWHINYFGQTQVSGQDLTFYQRGVLMGGVTAPKFMNIYANEQWLKDKIDSEIMNYLLIASRVPGNRVGAAQINSVLQQVIDSAVINGTISASSDLTEDQKKYITMITNDPYAWFQVQSNGYYKQTKSEYTVINGLNQAKIVYLLVYKKDDDVNKIEGTNVLI